MITIPKNPNKTANHLHGPTILPNNGTESAVRKMGVAKTKVAAVAYSKFIIDR